MQPNTLVPNEPITLPPIGSRSTAATSISRDYSGNARQEDFWSPRNADYDSGGVFTMRRGLENSVNVVTAHLLDGGIDSDPAQSLDDVCATAKAAKIYTDCVRYYPFVLGAQPVRMIDLAAFYAAVANEGALPQPHGIDSIEQNGQTIYQYPKAPLPRIGAADRASFYQLKTMLQGVVARGTARAIGGLSPYVAGKTGTTEDAVDGWFIGFTNDVTVAVWVGYDNGDGKRRSLGSNETGARVALPIFQPIIEAIWAEHIAPKTPLNGPSPEAKRFLVDIPIDYMTGNRVGGANNGQQAFRSEFARRRPIAAPQASGGFIEHFRRGADGQVADTQYQLVSREDAYASSGPTSADDKRLLGQSFLAARPERRRPMDRTVLLSQSGLAAAAAATAAIPTGGLRPVPALDLGPLVPQPRAQSGSNFWGGRCELKTIRDPQELARRKLTPKKLRENLECGRGTAIVLLGLFCLLVGLPGFASAAGAQDFTIDDVAAARKTDVAADSNPARSYSAITPARTRSTARPRWSPSTTGRASIPTEKKFLALFPSYTEPTVAKTVNGNTAQVLEKLYMYVAQARFVLDKAPGAIDLSRYVTLPFLEKIDPAIKHQPLARRRRRAVQRRSGHRQRQSRPQMVHRPHDARSACSRPTSSRARSRWASCWSTNCATAPKKSPTISISRVSCPRCRASRCRRSGRLAGIDHARHAGRRRA